MPIRPSMRFALGLAATAPLAVAGCGGDDSARQDADEPSGTFALEVVEADFPERQRLARQVEMAIKVRNRDDRTVPNVAVTVDSFSRRSDQANLADPERPVWIIDNGPEGGTTAYTNTWALGSLRPGQTRTFRWRVTAVEPGSYRLRYRVAAGLDGKAKARTPGGGVPAGRFDVRILRRAPDARVDPATGDVKRDEKPPLDDSAGRSDIGDVR